jgi:hypothetical protein
MRAAAFKPLAEVVNANSQPLLEEAAAIGALVSKLQPMMQRAQQLQQGREHPIAAALAAAAASAGGGGSGGAASAAASRRRTGGKAAAAKGDAAAAAAAAGVAAASDAGGADVAQGVEQQVRQMKAEAGASLQQLQQLNSALSCAEQQ